VLKDKNWQEVLRDPSVLNADIRDTSSGHTAACKDPGCGNAGLINEDDSSVPAPDGPYAYLRKFREGQATRDGGAIEIVLDGDQLAANHEYFKFGARHSPDHRFEAWSADIKVRNITIRHGP